MKRDKRNYILIDSIYIHNGGGKTLLDILCEKISENGDIDNYFFLFDKRYQPIKKILNNNNYIHINSSELKRKKFYKTNLQKFDRFLCFGNVPPPITIDKKVDIYFHNDLLIKPLNNNTSIINKIKLFFKKYYIISKNNKNYSWCVQTANMSEKLSKFFKISNDKIHVFPIYNNNFMNIDNKIDNSFLYVSNFGKHKNHRRLFDAFIHASNKIKHAAVTLNLTIDEREFKNSFYSKLTTPDNLTIVNHGVVNKSKLNELYNKSKYLIFPSLNESFGLPLIEAVLRDCYIICSDREYAYQIVRPSLTFNPNSIESISKSIFSAYKNKGLSKPKLLVENKIDTFEKYIQEYV